MCSKAKVKWTLDACCWLGGWFYFPFSEAGVNLQLILSFRSFFYMNGDFLFLPSFIQAFNCFTIRISLNKISMLIVDCVLWIYILTIRHLLYDWHGLWPLFLTHVCTHTHIDTSIEYRLPSIKKKMKITKIMENKKERTNRKWNMCTIVVSAAKLRLSVEVSSFFIHQIWQLFNISPISTQQSIIKPRMASNETHFWIVFVAEAERIRLARAHTHSITHI